MSQYSGFKVDLKNKNSTWSKVYELVKNKSTVLDIGCSAGYFDEVLIKNKNCIVDGVELNVEDAHKAKKICRDVLIVDIENYDFSRDKQRSYDHILFLDVLEHLKDPAKVLLKCRQLLKKNGSIIFSIPNMSHMSVRLELLNGSFAYENEGLLDKTHLHFWDKDSINELVGKSMYKTITFDYVKRDIPLQQIKKGLNLVGLKITSRFIKIAKTEKAQTYQYVFEIIPSTKKSIPSSKRKQKSFKPTTFYEHQIKELQSELRKNIALNNELHIKIENLKNTTGKKIIHRAKKVKKLFKIHKNSE